MRQKNLQKYHWVCLELVIYFWAWGLPLSVVCFPSETLLEKTKFSFGSTCKLEIVSWLGMGHMSTSTTSHPGSGSPSGLDLLLPSLRVHLCISSVASWRHCFPGIFHPAPPPGFYNLLLLPQSFLRPEWRDLLKTSHLGLDIPRSHTPCTLSGCGSQHLLPSSATGRFSDDGRARHCSASLHSGESTFTKFETPSLCYQPVF